MRLDSSDLQHLWRAISSANWSDKKYLDNKKSLIGRMGDIPTQPCSDLLKKLYYAEEDTVELQYTVLESLLQQQTSYAFSVFRDIYEQ